MKSDAVLFGSIGHPRFDNDPSAKVRPEQGLLAMRKKLGLFANIRPLITFPSLLEKSPLKNDRIEGADFVAIRELTGGLYFGQPQGRSENGDTAYDTCIYTRMEVERILKLSFEFAMKRKKRLTVVDKANVLATSRLWRQIAKEMEPQYPEVEVEYMFVDNAAMQLIQWPKRFDVMVTENMFGDILTDEASVIAGSLGMLPSASIGTHTSVFEPIHGSYPQAAGKNIANPCAHDPFGRHVVRVCLFARQRSGSYKESSRSITGSRSGHRRSYRRQIQGAFHLCGWRLDCLPTSKRIEQPFCCR